MKKHDQLQILLEPFDNKRLNNLCGSLDNNIKIIEEKLQVNISRHGNSFLLKGHIAKIKVARDILEKLFEKSNEKAIEEDDVHTLINEKNSQTKLHGHRTVEVPTRKKIIKSRSPNQSLYMDNIKNNDINFAIGPAGTGKTYLAVACATEALELGLVKKIIFIRPAVEAGEKLGFLPGDMAEKVNPYLRPLYDALYDMLGFETADKLVQQNIIEIAPLAFMRGRTLSDAFIILDEGQNTTVDQMKMFLTRMGFNSKMVITGDISQIDLNIGIRSGLVHAVDILSNCPGIIFNKFEGKDIVRHPLVQEIVKAYESNDI